MSSQNVAKWHIRQAIRDKHAREEQQRMNDDQFAEICEDNTLQMTHSQLLAKTIAVCVTTTCDFNVDECDTLTAELEELCESSICVAIEGQSDDQHRKCLDVCLGFIS